eukprot:2315889-Heterocapsa_arctica.AAC.1
MIQLLITNPNLEEPTYLKEFGGKRSKFTIKEGWDIKDDNEKKKLEELKEKFVLHMKKKAVANMSDKIEKNLIKLLFA